MKLGAFHIARDMEQCTLPPQVQTAFDEVYGKRLGCHFTPVLYCGAQVTSGMNYMIICKVVPVVTHPELAEQLIKLVIHAPLPGSENDDYHELSQETLIGPLAAADGVTSANPYVEYQHIYEAEYAVGFPIYVCPKIHNSVELEHIYVVGGTATELDYKNGMCLRQTQGIRDISGRYEKFDEVKTFSVDRFSVQAKGSAGKYQSILWHDDRKSFSLFAPDGMSVEEICAFVSTLTVVN